MTTLTREANPVRDRARVEAILRPSRALSEADWTDMIDRVVDSGCLLEGHFELQSKDHSDLFFRFSDFSGDWDNADAAGRLLARMRRRGPFNGVVAPDTAGRALAQAISDCLVVPLYVVKTDPGHHPIADFENEWVPAGARVLVVNDILTTGAGIRQMCKIVRCCRAEVEGVGMFASRDSDPVTLVDPSSRRALPTMWLLDMLAPRWSKEECPLCKKDGDANLIPARDLN